PSRTAVRTALHRAAHLLLDADPKILEDRFARAFAGYESDDALLRALDGMALVDFPRMRALFCVRSRYAEDELVRACSRGVGQYVVLGAGLDSFAYRRPEALATLDVFEIDHPATQEWKRARVEQLGIAAPAWLHYAPVDFEHATLAQGLAVSGIDLTRPIFFSWLGTTQYLSTDAVRQTLEAVAAVSAPGSELVMQVIVPPARLAPEEAALVSALAARAASVGEPWLSYFEPANLARDLCMAGFGGVTHFDQRQATARYLQDRADGLTLPAYFHMITVQLG
ncbi:MAG: class I SAM-dependent methyltransferase, partial [Sinobacteraceae bacterium]|nr:class I SAM-dependent methyltransferase [Nevskiaceae bacterium]